ncbi:hypothetical protein OPS25_03965 [Alteromonas ponticola]|uniref:Uncharacterized protein n=1 Tax=Alteromonas aquimaris TaxID=2998417 RepID=A0ABT3P4I1_9ALTE|nr:hypothetical protein [Alteromonas aquimaris]MCW8107659.1 hypothetical protein [Alteromonas aquimaris]
MSPPSQAKNVNVHTLLIVALTFICALVIWLVYDSLRPAASACEAIFQQSEMQLGVKLHVLKNQGEIVLGRQPIAELTEKVQAVAVNLKACCVMHSGDTDNRGFAQCQSRFNQFTTSLTQLESQVSNATQLHAKGGESALVEARQAASALLEDIYSVSDKLENEVNTLSAPPLVRNGELFLSEQFEGEGINERWRIIRPDNDRWMLQPSEKTLLIVTQPGSQVEANDSLRNVFVLNQALPQEDFVVETKVALAIQHQKNGASLGLWENADNYLEVGYFGFSHGYNVRRSPFFRKELRGKAHLVEENLNQHGRVKEPETIHLRISKQGNKYLGWYALVQGDEAVAESAWKLIATHAVPNFNGKVALWASNDDGKVYSTTASETPEIPVEFGYVIVK